MAEVDTSMYPTQPGATMQQRFGEAATAIGALNAATLQQQEIDANRALPGIFGKAINQDGSIDPQKLMMMAPGAGIRAGEIAKSAQDLQLGATGNLKAQQDLITQQANQVYSAWGSLLQDPKNPLTYDSAVKSATEQLKLGRISAPVFSSLMRELPTDPNELRNYVTSRSIMAMPDASAPTKIGVTSEGAEQTGTKGQMFSKATSSEAGAGVQTSLAPGIGEAAAAAGASSGELLGKDRSLATQYQQLSYPLTNAIPALEELGPNETGPGTEAWNNVRSFLQTWDPTGLADVDAKKTTLYQEAHKWLTQNITMNGDTSTNDKLAATFSSNPNMSMQNAAVVALAKSALSLQRLRQAQVIQFDRANIPDNKYSQWAANWNNNQDARAYGVDLMKPDQIKSLVGSLKGSDKAKFFDSLRNAIAAGVVNPNKFKGAANAAQ